MTGAEHYAQAERLQEHARQLLAAPATGHEKRALWHARTALAEAQVHATLALAAVIGLSADLDTPERQAWRKAAAAPLTG